MIRFSKKEDYAVILINRLVQNYNKRLTPLSEVSNMYKISPLFLRNLANQLMKHGIIKAVEGKKGGYFLTKEPSLMKVGEILSVFSKKPMLDCCPLENLKKIKCPQEEFCQPGLIWRKLNKNFLEKIYGLNLVQFFNNQF